MFLFLIVNTNRYCTEKGATTLLCYIIEKFHYLLKNYYFAFVSLTKSRSLNDN